MASPTVYYRVEKNTSAHAAQLEWEKRCTAYSDAVNKIRKILDIPKSVLSYHSPYGLAGFGFKSLPDGWRRSDKTSECCIPRRDTPKGKADYKMIFELKRPGTDALKTLFFGVTDFIMDNTDARRGGGIPTVSVGISYGRGADKESAYLTTRMVLVKAGKPIEGLTELTASQYEAAIGKDEAAA